MKVLVTGAAGFIGHHLTRRLLDQGHAVVGVDNLNDYYDVRLKLDRLRELGVAVPSGDRDAAMTSAPGSGLRFLRLELADAERVLALCADERFDVIYHLAAQAGVRHSLSDPWAYVASNVNGFLSILEAARRHPVRHLVYASSSSVYGLDRLQPFGEAGAADHPANLYAASKRSNELMAHSYSHLFALPTTGLRFFTVYGPWGRPDMALFSFTKAILSGAPLELFNYGKMRRDFTYVDDVVEAVLLAGARPPQGDAAWDGRQSSVSPAPARVYNVGHGAPVSLGEFVTALEEELGMKAQVKKVPLQPGDVPQTWADCSALQRDFGFRPQTPLRAGVKRFVAWYRRYYHD